MTEQEQKLITGQANCKLVHGYGNGALRFDITPDRGLRPHKRHPGDFIFSRSAGIDASTGRIVPLEVGREAYNQAYSNREFGSVVPIEDLLPMSHATADSYFKHLLEDDLVEELINNNCHALGHVAVFTNIIAPNFYDFEIPEQIFKLSTGTASKGKYEILAINISIAAIRLAFKDF